MDKKGVISKSEIGAIKYVSAPRSYSRELDTAIKEKENLRLFRETLEEIVEEVKKEESAVEDMIRLAEEEYTNHRYKKALDILDEVIYDIVDKKMKEWKDRIYYG